MVTFSDEVLIVFHVVLANLPLVLFDSKHLCLTFTAFNGNL